MVKESLMFLQGHLLKGSSIRKCLRILKMELISLTVLLEIHHITKDRLRLERKGVEMIYGLNL